MADTLIATRPHLDPLSRELREFYRRTGVASPALDPLDPADLPASMRHLLDHHRDMTPTLEEFYGDRLQVRVLGRLVDGPLYYREVALTLTGTGRPVEYGVIRVHLDRLPPTAQARVRAEQQPFGRILQEDGLPHQGWPGAFFQIRRGARLRALLDLPHGGPLYGRRNLLANPVGQPLAEVVEILAPVAGENPDCLCP